MAFFPSLRESLGEECPHSQTSEISLVKHAEIARLLPIFLLPEDGKLYAKYTTLARDSLGRQKKARRKSTLGGLKFRSGSSRRQSSAVEKLDLSFLEIFGGGVAGTHLASFIEDRFGDKQKALVLKKSVPPQTQEGVITSVQAFIDAVCDHCHTILVAGSAVTLLSPGNTHLFVDLVLEVLVFLAWRVVSEVVLSSTPVEEWNEEDYERIIEQAAGEEEEGGGGGGGGGGGRG